VGINIRRDAGRARNKWQFTRSLVRYKNKSISSQITAFGRPLCRLSTGECHLTGYLVCTNTLCSIIRSLYAAVSVLSLGQVDFKTGLNGLLEKPELLGSQPLFLDYRALCLRKAPLKSFGFSSAPFTLSKVFFVVVVSRSRIFQPKP
jgi:hypothetical protein